MTNELSVDEDFIEENKKNLGQFMPKSRKSGPYSKIEKEQRRTEVYRLHFEYGYSGRKISDMLKINRNTANGDIEYWYSQILKNCNNYDPEPPVLLMLETLDAQRTRIRENLDKIEKPSERISYERLIFDIDSKTIHILQRLSESTYHTNKIVKDTINVVMQKLKKNERHISSFDTYAVSQKSHEKINKIIADDKERRITP